jgi:DNA-binding GntR family transcriptional regulator
MGIFDSGPNLQRDNVSAAVAAHIRKAIMDGRLMPGERLKESALAETFGISRTPIREALMMLQTDGLITTVPHRGSVVRAFATAEVEDIFLLRTTLEAFAATRACERRTEDDLASMGAAIDRLEAMDVTACSIADIWRENVAFHMGVAEAAHTAKLVDFLRNLFDLPVYYQRPVEYSETQKQQFVRAHRAILDRIVARDAGGAEAMVKAHISEARIFAVEQARLRVADADGEPADDDADTRASTARSSRAAAGETNDTAAG